MNFRNISSWAIRNPVPPLVLFAALLLAGLVSFSRLDVNLQPDISFPAAQVLITQPGAAPTEMETQITQRVEAAVRSISNVDEINSTVTEGSSSTVVQFVIGTPVDRAVADVKNAIDRIRSDLPEGILEPQVIRVDFEGMPMAYFSVETSDMTLEELSWFVDNTVAKRLLGVSGMAAVTRGGGVSREIRVILDPARLQSQGITAAQVNQQLRQTNLNAAGGRAEIAGSEQSVRVLGNAADAYSLGQTQITLSTGRAIKLADIATVKDMYGEQRSISLMNGRQVTSFAMQKAKGASDVTVYDNAVIELDKLQKEFPKVRFKQLFTTVDYTKSQYHSSMSAMIEGAVLAVVVVFLFLRDWRATFISALAIPLSAIPTFWFMDMMDFTLNNVSLIALSLVAGVLVDDAIVEIENIVRHMRMGKTAYQASIDAADEIGLAVLATTMSIVAVFLPVAMMPGISGQFFKQFGLTVITAVLISLAVARLISPMIAAYFLKAHGEEEHGGGWLMDRYMVILRWTLDQGRRAEEAARGGVHRITALRHDHRIWTMGIGVVALLLTVVSFGTLPSAFQPEQDSSSSAVNIEMVPGTTLAQTQAVANRVAQIGSASFDGKMVDSAFADVKPGEASVYFALKKKRPMSSGDWQRAVAPQFDQIADARINFQKQNGAPGQTRDIAITLGSEDAQALDKAASRIAQDMMAIKEVRGARVEGDMPRPEILIKPRLDLAADLGVTTAALSQTIRIATIGDIDQNSAKFSLEDRQIPIRVSLEENSRRDISTIENLPVPTANGGSVPLKVVADVEFGSGPTQIRRYNQIRRAVVGADLAPGYVSGDAMKKIEKLDSLNRLPPGVTRLSAGDTKAQAELTKNFSIAVVSGIMLVLAVLVLLYRRLMPPFVNMGSLLLAPLGTAIALHIAGQPLSLPVFIGILMLLGIVAKNSILVIDFALEEMMKGVPETEAIIDAGHKRAQPIIMTTVAMVAGMVPTALSLSGDGSWRAPMGIAVIGGLTLSTLLTLIIVPSGFSLAIGVENWIGPRLGRKLLTYEEGDDTKPHAAAPAE